MGSKEFFGRVTEYLMGQHGRLYPMAEYVAPEEAMKRMADDALRLRAELAAANEALEFAKDFGEGAHRLVGHLQRELERMRGELAAAKQELGMAERAWGL